MIKEKQLGCKHLMQIKLALIHSGISPPLPLSCIETPGQVAVSFTALAIGKSETVIKIESLLEQCTICCYCRKIGI